MKRFFAIAILSILLTNTAGFYAYYVVQLRQIRAEMRQALKYLPDDQMEILTLTPEEYKEARVDEHEVKVDGRMYDIARMKKDGNRIIIYALHDKKEDNLLALVAELVSKPLKDKGFMPASILEFLSLTFLPPTNELVYPVTVFNRLSTLYHFSVKAARTLPEPPPPKPGPRSLRTHA